MLVTKGDTFVAVIPPTMALAVVFQEEFGTPFVFYDAKTGAPLSHHSEEENARAEPQLSPDEVRLLAAVQIDLTVLPNGNYRAAVRFRASGLPTLVAVGELSRLASGPQAVQERKRLEKWLRSFSARLQLANQPRKRPVPEGREDTQAGTAGTWECLLTLEQVLRRLRIHKKVGEGQQRILQAACKTLQVQTLVWVPSQVNAPILLEGDALISSWDSRQLAALVSEKPEARKAGWYINNEVRESSWGALFPQIESLMILAISTRRHFGSLIAFNKRTVSPASPHGPTVGSERALFRRSDVVLLTPFVALLDFQLRASAHYGDLKHLLVGLTRSLTSVIDAKDSYTYGHSERVARIAVELGGEMGLPEDELSDIYLAGLLHDIGKIGIRDAVLCKKEPLTPEEAEHLREHVKIGYKILEGLQPIQALLGGVLSHHERYDGKGYPNGLAGEAIPLLARILAVADGYDAMSTARPYRAALPREQVEAILIQGAGTQWDKRVVEAFLRVKDRVHLIRQRGVGESLGQALNDVLHNRDSSVLGRSVGLRSGTRAPGLS